ncbi:MAG: purine-nucleoside phosphorylase [Christensenellales bacterium]
MMINRIRDAANYIRDHFTMLPNIGIVLGSGLNSYADTLEKLEAVPYLDIRGFSVSKVPGHASRLVTGYKEGIPVLMMQGRLHCYEGNTPQQVAFPIWVMRELGIEFLIVTNAAGGINREYAPGDFVIIKDHINVPSFNPLIGENMDHMGPRFPNMVGAYDPDLRAVLKEAGNDCKLNLKEGVYAMMSGPSFETPAEIRMLETIGADLVGMSTVPEVIAARHSGIRVAGISLITNYAAGITGRPLSHIEVNEVGKSSESVFVGLMDRFLFRLNDSILHQ